MYDVVIIGAGVVGSMLAGGLVQSEKDINEAAANGASAISTTKSELWGI